VYKRQRGLGDVYKRQDKTLISHIQELLKLEGDKLFQYQNESKIIGISSTDVNEYIQTKIGKEFTVKDFRSYAANYYFVKTLMNNTKKNAPKNNKIIKKNIKDAIEQTAFHLRHTPSISKKSYVLNFAIEVYQTNPAYFIDAAKDKKSVDDVILELLTQYAEKCGKIEKLPVSKKKKEIDNTSLNKDLSTSIDENTENVNYAQ
jgi:DNA topoisomerase IB